VALVTVFLHQLQPVCVWQPEHVVWLSQTVQLAEAVPPVQVVLAEQEEVVPLHQLKPVTAVQYPQSA